MKQMDVKELPGKNIQCPYCGTSNYFPKGKIDRKCAKCGKAYFRG